MFACIHSAGPSETLLACARAFSPLVEQAAPDTVVLDIEGLERIFGLPQEIAAAIARQAAESGLQARVAVASNPDAAVHAAVGFSGISVIPYGDEAKFLESLPLHLLSPAPEMAETFARWGLRCFRDLAALPELGVAARLGEEGLRLWKLARGEGDRLLKLLEDPLLFEEELELEHPVELLEPLLFVLARLLQDICGRLAARSLATNEVHLRLKLENQPEHARVLRLPVPLADPRTFLKLLQLDLTGHPPPAPVLRVYLRAEPVKPRVTQNGLYVPLAPEPEKLELTLARLAALAGEENVGSPELLDTHRPGAFRMRRFGAGGASRAAVAERAALAFRVFRPPREARVRVDAGDPVFVFAEGIRGAVLSSAGPWRSAGDWWTSTPWERDAWDVALSDGAVYRIYCEPRGWFVEGSYD